MEDIMLPPQVKISDQVLCQEIEGEAVLLNLKNEQYFGLNEIGTRIWQLLSENTETERVLSSLQNEYKVSEAVLRKDLAVLIDKLQEQDLVIIENKC